MEGTHSEGREDDGSDGGGLGFDCGSLVLDDLLLGVVVIAVVAVGEDIASQDGGCQSSSRCVELHDEEW